MNESHVHVEREKTKRTLIVASAITLVGLVCAVLFFRNVDDRGGTLKVTKDGVEVSLETPIIQQIGAGGTSFKVLGDTIPVSSGTISDLEIKGGQDSGGFIGKRFNGKNLIDTAAGFILPSGNPDRWQVQKPAAGTDVLIKLVAGDGSMLEVKAVPVKGLPPLTDYVQSMLDSLKGIDPKANAKAANPDSTAWMIWHTNPETKVVVCMKIVDANDQRFVAFSESTKPESKASVVNSVAGFSVIVKPNSLRAVQRVPSVAPGTKRLPR